MRADIIAFFKKFKGVENIELKDIKDFFYKFHDFEVFNPNQYYLFRQQLNYFLTYTSSKVREINWDRLKSYQKRKK